jgi:cell division septation protein DedD
MIAPLDSKGNPDATGRRNSWRQEVLFSSVLAGESNCGRVLNISPNGLALQTDTELVGDEFPHFRFRLSPSLAWVEARGRVVWRNNPRNVVGIEFIGLTEEVQKQIKTWIALRRESRQESKPILPVTESHRSAMSEAALNITAPSPPQVSDFVAGNRTQAPLAPVAEYAAEASLAQERASDSGAENQGQAPILPAVPSTTETIDARTLDSGANDLATGNRNLPPIVTPVRPPESHDALIAATVGVERRPGKALKIVGLALLTIFLLLAFFLRVRHRHEPANIENIEKEEEPARARPPATPLPQPVQPAPSSERPAARTPQPAFSASSSAAPSPNRKLTLHRPAYVLQVAAMIHEENANALAALLRQENFPAFVVKPSTKRFYQVLVGPYNSADAATEVKNDLEKRGFKVIRTERKVPAQ